MIIGLFASPAIVNSLAFETGGSLPQPCGSGNLSDVCFGAIDTRNKLNAQEKVMFNRAANAAIDTVYSPEFAAYLDDFRTKVDQQADTSEKWNKVRMSWAPMTNEQIITRLKSEMNGMQVDTFGYLAGVFKLSIYGTKAKDGGKGPILLNRAALKNATVASLANTFVHEAAHKIGLSHDKPEHCRAPYAIGDIAEHLLDSNIPIVCKFDS